MARLASLALRWLVLLTVLVAASARPSGVGSPLNERIPPRPPGGPIPLSPAACLLIGGGLSIDQLGGGGLPGGVPRPSRERPDGLDGGEKYE
ncbi:hypothetical protein FJT64_012381 [Amphibalanus amphitrite]|uniref:Uncharacterized protein n=1 Tax=Amphibalanus amphitrite TaxID=1232801 RepID=A0A6A4V6N8_AMPAM|nr:hypothetical protein FJT64_012381 [Amphibalanus amphitrite]